MPVDRMFKGVADALNDGLQAARLNQFVARLKRSNRIVDEWCKEARGYRAYAEQLKERVDWLELNLKKQSAKRKGLDAVRVMSLKELEIFADPEKMKGLNYYERSKKLSGRV